MDVIARARKRTYEVMEVGRPGDQLSRMVDASIMALVAGNIVAVILASVESISRSYHDLFVGFEQVSVAVFTAEFICRFWAAREKQELDCGPWRSRLRYVRSPMAIVDLVAIAPFYLASFFAMDLRFLRVLRLLRVVKLTRYSIAMNRLTEVFQLQRSALMASFFLMGITIIMAASTLYFVERHVQPEAFGSIPAAMWWAICTLTTVGYGDVTPVTTMGKILTSGLTIVGIAMVALPTSLFASGFAHVMSRNERALEEEARDALMDGVITDEEADTYTKLAESLHVEPDVAREIIDAMRKKQALHDQPDCPHCGKPISG